MDEAHKHGFEAPGGDLIFRRNPDGSVTVYAPEPGETTFTPARWASIVAAASYRGEGDLAYRSAYGFHTGEEPPASPSANAADLQKR